MRTKKLFAMIALIGAGLWLAPAVAEAQDGPGTVYRIGVGDLLRVSVWQEPTLDREVEVAIDSTIVLPLVGSIRAGGYTPAELSRILTDRYSLYKRDISQVEVVVIEFNSREIFVIGAVTNPGRLAFQEIPDVWDVIMTAGGPATDAYLREVRIMRGEGTERRSIPIDLNQYLLGGDRESLPMLRPGDTVYIPHSQVEGVDAFADKIVYVFGDVVKPGMYLVGQSDDLVGALLVAGGIAEGGDRKRVRIIREEGIRRVVTEVNLDDYLVRGDMRANPTLRAGDTVQIPPSRGKQYRQFFEDMRGPLQLFTTTMTAILLVDRLSNNDNR